MSEKLPAFPGPEPGSLAPGGMPGSIQPFAPVEEGGESGVDLMRYLQTLLRYKWMILAVVALGAVAGVYLASQVRPTYMASASIWIDASGGQNSRAQEEGPIQTDALLESSAWESLLRQYVVLDYVVREQRLYLDYSELADSLLFRGFDLDERFLPGDYKLTIAENGASYELTNGDNVVIERGTVGDSIGRAAGFRWQPERRLIESGREIGFLVTTPRDAATRLSTALQVELPERYGNFMSIQLPGSNPTRMAATLNSVAERYVAVAAELKRAKLDELTAILEEQLDIAEISMTRAEMELEAFRVQTITLPSDPATPVTPGLEQTQDPAFESFFELRTNREELRRDQLAIADALESQAESGETPVERLWTVGSVQESTELRQALEELTDKQAELRALSSQFTDEHPEVRRLTTETTTLRDVTVPRLARTLMTQLSEREQALDQLIDGASTELRQIPPRMIEEARLQRRMETSENLYGDVRARFEAARLAAVSSIPDVRVLDRATPPNEPTNPGEKPKVLLMALMASMGLAVGVALLLDRMDRRVRYPTQVTSEIGLPILGAVQLAPANESEQTEQVVEAFRELRLAIMHAYGAAGPIVLTVTSPGSADGKSFVSSNLALAFADLGYRTLIVDGDIRRGTLHHVLGGTRKPGLTDYLAGDVQRSAVIQQAQYPNVQFIAAGAWRRSGPELLASPKMRALLADLRSQYQVIIFDSSPLGAGVDPYVLGTITGNMLMVLRTGATDRELAGAKLDALHRLPIRVLGAVLNAVPARGHYKYYSYLSSYQLPPGDEPRTPSEPSPAGV